MARRVTNERRRAYTAAMKSISFIALVGLFAVSAAWPAPNQTPSAAKPAATQQMVIPSHGAMLYGIFYLAAGEGPHPTAVIFHGFPGYEQNPRNAADLSRAWLDR